jgi:hypothetical protein
MKELTWHLTVDLTRFQRPRRAVPLLRRLVTGLSPRRPWFDPRSVHVGFVVDKVALGQVFPRVLRFSPVNFIPRKNEEN